MNEYDMKNKSKNIKDRLLQLIDDESVLMAVIDRNDMGDILAVLETYDKALTFRDDTITKLIKETERLNNGISEIIDQNTKRFIDENIELEKDLARRDEIIARLKEDGERLANSFEEMIGYENLPITLHRALMEELE